MNLKLGIFISLLSLVACASLTKENNYNETAISAKPRHPRAIPVILAAGAFIMNTKKAVDVINIVTGFVTGMDGVINLIKNDKSDEEFQNEVKAKLKDFSKKMDNLNQGIAKLHDLMIHNTDRIIADTRLQGYETFRQQLNEELNYIETKYMNSIAPIISNLTNYDLEDLNEHLKPILENGIVEEKLIHIKFSSELHGKTHSEETKNLFESVIIISKDQKDKHLECNDLSAYNKLFFYYDYVVKMVTQGYNMLLWTYQYRRLQDHDRNAINKNLQLVLQNRQKEAIIKITEAAQRHLHSVDNISWRSAYACDPERWEEGKNYIRVKPFKQHPCGDVPNCEASRPTVTEKPSIFSLMLVSCDTSKYEVVTSARFYEKNGIIGVEPQCGVFVEGQVDTKTLRWNTWNRDHYSRDNLPPNYIELGSGVSSFYLDDIVLPEGEFLTAVGFKIFDHGRHETRRISIVAQGTKMYDFKGNETGAGKTFDRYPVRDYSKSKHVRSPEYILSYVPAITQNSQTYEMSEPGIDFIGLFYTRRGVRVDNFPSVGPNIDMNEYKPFRVLPLGGIGLMYKSIPNHLGILAFKFISTKFTSHIREDYAERLNQGKPW